MINYIGLVVCYIIAVGISFVWGYWTGTSKTVNIMFRYPHYWIYVLETYLKTKRVIVDTEKMRLYEKSFENEEDEDSDIKIDFF